MMQLSDKTLKDLIVISGLLVVAFFLFSSYDVLEAIVDFSSTHEQYEIDELFATLMFLALCMLVFAWRCIKDVDSARQLVELKNQELQKALSR